MDSRQRPVSGQEEARRKAPSNSTALIVLGAALFVMGGVLVTQETNIAGFLFAILGVGLVVAGIVTRPRT